MRPVVAHVERQLRIVALTGAVALVAAVVGCGTAEPGRSAPSAPSAAAGVTGDGDGDAGGDGDGDGAAADERCATVGVTTVRDQVYAERPGVDPTYLALDLSVPERAAGCPPVPVVVYVHGGGFSRGDKSNGVDAKVARITAEGWAFASVNYRLVGAPGTGGLVSPHPGQADDVATALAHLAQHADQLGIDGERLALLGHSAGAFLVAQVGADDRVAAGADLDPTALRCVAPVDTEGYDVADNVDRSGLDVWDAAFPDASQHAEASPAVQVAASSTPRRWLIVGRGAPARLAAAETFADAIEDAGGAAEVLDASTYDHEGVNAAIGRPDDDVVTPALVALLHGCFGTSPPG